MILPIKYQDSALWFQTRRFFMFSLHKPIENMWPLGGLFLNLGPLFEQTLGKVPIDDARYQISRPYA